MAKKPARAPRSALAGGNKPARTGRRAEHLDALEPVATGGDPTAAALHDLLTHNPGLKLEPDAPPPAPPDATDGDDGEDPENPE